MIKTATYISIIVSILSVAGLGAAKAPTPFQKTTEAPKALKLIKPAFRYLKAEFYGESFSFVGDLDDGGFFQAQFAVTNAGFSDGKGSVRIIYVSKSGKHEQEIIKLDFDEQKKLPDGVQFGKSSLKLENGEYKIAVRGSKFSADVVYTPMTPSFRPGNGRVVYDEKGAYYDIAMLFLRGALKGSLSIDGKKIALKGFATANNSYSAYAPYKQAEKWFRFVSVKEETAVLFTLLYPEEGEPIGWFVVSQKGKLKEYSVNTQLKYSGLKKAIGTSYGYELPEKFKLELKDKPIEVIGGDRRQIFMQDVLEDLGSVVGFLAKRFFQPESFTLRYDAKIKMNETITSVPGIVEITILKK